MQRVVAWLVVTSIAVLAMLTAPACKSSSSASVLQASDLAVPDAGFVTTPFDRNTIIDSASFTDSETIQHDDIQKFFAKSPYSRPSFLETYQSNGVRASDAIATSAHNYRINPLVILVLLEATQGLIGQRNYVFPPERVEYVFQCGCTQSTSCAQALAGLDRQVDCLARKLRDSLDTINSSDATAGGWGTGKPTYTLDNQAVTPSNDATAALYDWNPRIATGEPGGTWLFWNLWNIYSTYLNYSGPLGTNGGKWIGDACNANDECQTVQGAVCATNYTNGMCMVACSPSVACPSGQNRAESYCAQFQDGYFCAPTCNKAAPSCRDGGACLHVPGADGTNGYICALAPN